MSYSKFKEQITDIFKQSKPLKVILYVLNPVFFMGSAAFGVVAVIPANIYGVAELVWALAHMAFVSFAAFLSLILIYRNVYKDNLQEVIDSQKTKTITLDEEQVADLRQQPKL